MQIIQSIRDKGAAIIIVVIALSLIGFILMDSKSGSNNASASSSKTIGKVDGQNIELTELNKRTQESEAQEQQRTGQAPNAARINQIREQAWNQLVAETIFFKEAEKLGITFTSKELSAILLSNDQSNPFLQQQGLVDATTGKLDMAKAQEALVNIKKAKGDQRLAIDAQVINPLKLSTTAGKYSGLIAASAYYPAWMQEKEAADANSFANISYVAIPYSEISDSVVKINDADINDYVSKHKALFKQEAGRKISYVAFSQLPSAADSAKVKDNIEGLKPSFGTDTSAQTFVAQNTSLIPFQDVYMPKAKIASSQTDSIVSAPQGTVYGPYLDQAGYVLAKVLGSKELPDSVNVRHILIGTNDPQTGKAIMQDSVAKKLADSVLAAINGGADFAALVTKYSTDEGSKAKGGEYDHVYYGQMVPEFNDFIFNKPAGSKEVVRTQFGYHVIDILNQQDFKPAYKIAFVAKAIDPSDVTINDASNAATKAAAEKDGKALAAYAQKNGLQVTQSPAIIKEADFAVGNLQDARPLVKWAFEAKQGQVSDPFSIGDQFVVATVDKIYTEGTQDAATARSGAEAIIRNQKKAKMITDKIGANATLEKAAATYNKQVTTAGADSTLTFAAQMINGLGLEGKLIGAAFNKENQAKASAPIAGTSGVYVLKVNSIQSKPADAADIVAQKMVTRTAALRSQVNSWFEGLRKQADVKDERGKVF